MLSAANYQGLIPLWLRLLHAGLFIASAVLWLIGYREERTRSEVSISHAESEPV